jgi:hypothetical protein
MHGRVNPLPKSTVSYFILNYSSLGYEGNVRTCWQQVLQELLAIGLPLRFAPFQQPLIPDVGDMIT